MGEAGARPTHSLWRSLDSCLPAGCANAACLATTAADIKVTPTPHPVHPPKLKSSITSLLERRGRDAKVGEPWGTV